MKNLFTRTLTISIVWGLLAVSAQPQEGDFWDFLEDTMENIESGTTNSAYSAEALQDDIAASAQQNGDTNASAEHYADYANKLAMTLSMLSPSQQARVFSGE